MSPKIALAHDWFNTKIGGAERVAIELANLFPQAPIYTLIFNQDKFAPYIDPSRVHTSFLQHLPKVLHQHPRYLLPLIPLAVRSLMFSDYDLILSSSFGYIKNLYHPTSTKHICYCHTPLRAVWDYEAEYLAEQGVGPIQTATAKRLSQFIKRWDSKGSQRVNVWLANSQTVADRIQRYYHQSAQVIYPPVDTELYRSIKVARRPFYITLSMLTPYKKIDVVIEAFNQSGRELIVLGEGPETQKLKRLAKANIKLMGYVSETRKQHLLASAQALIFPNAEDFGIAPIEAMSAGTPVIAYNRGGVTETVVDHQTGILFNTQTAGALNKAVDQFEHARFSKSALIKQAARFSRLKFDQSIKEVVNRVSTESVS